MTTAEFEERRREYDRQLTTQLTAQRIRQVQTRYRVYELIVAIVRVVRRLSS